jgi:nucleotide-binding universal stress UspA family protein
MAMVVSLQNVLFATDFSSCSEAALPYGIGVEIGMPQERIPKAAEDLRADLIVMGPHHTFHPRISAHLPWAMLHQVLSRARCPVLRV